MKDKKADFVKVYSKLSRETYLAIADEARKQNMMFLGHVPETVSAWEASDLGQRTMEHLYGVLAACSNQEEEIRRIVAQAVAEPRGTALRAMNAAQQRALDSLDSEKTKKFIDKLAKNRTWHVPTLTVIRSLANADDPTRKSDPRLKYLPAFLRARWDTPGSAEAARFMKKIYAKNLELVGDMHKAGVPIAAGTDTTNPYCFPGFSLHDELKLLVEAGLSPMAALQSATSHAALCMGVQKESGTIEAGKVADLVLLDANPLDDIQNTTKIRAVFLKGRHLPREELDARLAEIESNYAPKKAN